MSLRPLVLFLALAAVAPALAQDAAAPKLESVTDRASYSIGLNFARNFKKQQIPFNADAFIKGLRDALGDGKPALNDKEIAEALQAFEQEVGAAQEARAKGAAEKNKKEGAAFLAANKSKEGVKTTKSGLQYKVLKEGTGPIPQKTDMVKTHYRGTLLDGTEFDSSIARNEPVTFPVTGVIPGWVEALQLMKVGSKWQLVIPSELAYGERGAGGDIGPNATLVFEIELLGIEKGEELPK